MASNIERNAFDCKYGTNTSPEVSLIDIIVILRNAKV